MRGENFDVMKMHFAWINWDLYRNKNLRKKIKNLTEEEKIELVQNETLFNQFLVKRLHSMTFSNLIYLKIINDPKIKKKILPEISKILSDNVMYKEDISRMISAEGLRMAVSFDIEPPTVILSKKAISNQEAIRYLTQKLDESSKEGDFEDIITLQSYLREYITGQFNIGDLFIGNYLMP